MYVSACTASLWLQGGSAGPAFLKLLETLEQQGIIERQFAPDLPKNLGGVSGWTVKDGMMEEWQRRRQVSPYPTSIYMSLRMRRACVLVLLYMCPHTTVLMEEWQRRRQVTPRPTTIYMLVLVYLCSDTSLHT